jgi:hypothetical protein
MERAIETLVREAIASGRLPKRSPDRQWGGPGADVDCPVCAKRIGAPDLEMEIEFTDPSPSRSETHHLHMACFAAWEKEIAEQARSDATTATDLGESSLFRLPGHGIIAARDLRSASRHSP